MVEKIKAGTKIRFTADSLGVFNRSGRGFDPEVVVRGGEEGLYISPITDMSEPGWHRCSVERDGQTYELGVGESHFEVIA